MESFPLIRSLDQAAVDMAASGNDTATSSDLPLADRASSLRMLGEALSIERMCAQRCESQAMMARNLDQGDLAEELERHATDARQHIQQLQARVDQLDGGASAASDRLASDSHSEYVGGITLIDMLNESLATERMAVAGYREMVAYLGEKDPVTRRLLEDIMAMEAVQVDSLMAQLTAHRV